MNRKKITREDIDFLQKLQHELNNQTTDDTADPVFWGVMEEKQMPAYSGCGDVYLYYADEVYYDTDIDALKNAIKKDLIDNELLDDDEHDLINDIESLCDAYDIMQEYDIDAELGEYQMQDVLSQETGAFLTKKACEKYILTNAHNLKKPRTYAMTANRNYELETLLKILKNADFSKLL